MKKGLKKKLLWFVAAMMLAIGGIIIFEIIVTLGRTQVQVNIHQNKELIYLSTFAEPPQFAVWLEDPQTHHCVNIFVTHRAGVGDWEGKSNVPVALPRWSELFKINGENRYRSAKEEDEEVSAVTGATPKEDYFSVRAEVKPGTKWICWVEMNLAGDYNDAYPERDVESKEVDEFSNGQPALLYRADIVATEGQSFGFILAGESLWKDEKTSIAPVGERITTAKEVFDKMDIEVIRPKPKLINLHKTGKRRNGK
ncbi:MAG: hypothetical protein AB2L24_24340 [Mangrovibacterium sp.]